MTSVQNAIIASVGFIILYWLVMSGGTAFNGDSLPPPLLVKFIWWVNNRNLGDSKEEVE